MTSEEIARLKVLASVVHPMDAYTVDDNRSQEVADAVRSFALVLGELERVTEENEALRTALVRVHGIAKTLAKGNEHTDMCPRRRWGECECRVPALSAELASPELLALLGVTK